MADTPQPTDPQSPETTSTEVPVVEILNQVLAAAKPPDEPTVVKQNKAPVVDDTPTAASKPKPEAPAVVRGQRLAHYELEETLGVGGMAAVLRAKDLTLDRPVALKVLPPDMARDAENVQRFHNEARAAAKLDHPNIARVYAFGIDQSLHYIAYEFVEGETLRARIERLGRLPVQEALLFTFQIATGLEHAVERGVIHRDIKPSNIIITPQHQAKLVDMGLARALDAHADHALTQSGVTLGTFDYISPEQALDPRAADCRSDIYSLGCTLYHALTGVPPVPPGTAVRKLQSHQHDLPADPRLLNPEIDEATVQLLGQMLAKKPKDRFQHPSALAEALKRILQPHVTPAAGSSIQRGLITNHSVEPGRTFTFILALVLLFALLSWMHFMQSSENPSGQPVSLAGRTAALPSPWPLASSAGAHKNTKTVPEAPEPITREVQTPAALLNALKESQQGTIVLNAPVFDMGRDGTMGIMLNQPDLTITGTSGTRPVLRLRSNSPPMDPTPRELIAVRRGRLKLQGLRIELIGTETAALTALSLLGGQVLCEDCEFVQKEEGASLGFGTSMSFLRTGRDPALPLLSVIEFRQCIFYGGQEGFRLEEGSKVVLKDCLIGPMRQPIRLLQQDVNVLGTHEIEMNQCTWLLGSGPGIRAEPRYLFRMVLRDSVISTADDLTKEVYLLQMSKDGIAATEFRGSGNVYHHLTALATMVDNGGTLRFLATVPQDWSVLGSRFSDDQSVMEKRWLFNDEDLRSKFSKLEPTLLREACRLKTNLTSVRSTPATMKGTRLLLGTQLYVQLDRLDQPTSNLDDSALATGTRELIVDGMGLKPLHFATLNSALAAVTTDEETTITIRQNGPIRVRPEDIGRRRITIRADEQTMPELQWSLDSSSFQDSETVLFRLHDGSLNLEQLAFRIGNSDKDTLYAQSLVQISGAGRCRIKSCQATLFSNNEVRSSLLATADLPGMPMPTASGMGVRWPAPTFEVQDSFIRGRGDLLRVRQSRPLDLTLRNLAIALHGTLLTVEVARPDVEPSSDGLHIHMERVTAYVTQGLFWLRSSSSMGSAHFPVRVNPVVQCLLAMPEPGSLIRVEGLRNEAELRRRFEWKGRRNIYAATGSLLSLEPMDRMDRPEYYDAPRWGELWGRDERDAQFARSLRFVGQLESRAYLDTVNPRALRVFASEPANLDFTDCGMEEDKIFYLGADPLRTSRDLDPSSNVK